MLTVNIINEGDDPINVGEPVYNCPCCHATHGIYSDCKQGQRA